MGVDHNLAHLLLIPKVNPLVSVEQNPQLDSVAQDILIKKKEKKTPKNSNVDILKVIFCMLVSSTKCKCFY